MLARLRAPFDVELIRWRVGARMRSNRNRGQALPYVTARLVQDRLDEVMGPENWRNEFAAAPAGGGVMCILSLRINGEWISKADIAQQDEVRDDAHDPDKDREIAVKGAPSDALKRAAVQWGIGRYLYSFEAPWVNLEQEKFIARDELPKLRQLLRHAFEDARGASGGGRATEGTRHSSSAEGSAPHAAPEAQQPQQDGRGEAPAQPAAKPAKGRPSFGTDEQWRSITPRQKLIVKSISDRVRHNAPLADIETFLTHGEGKDYPAWLREGLLAGVRAKMKEQADAAAHHSEVA
ncbi:MAG: Rad52/Rad22 family DNA repair protein [Steroidobacteraceae bacterium]